jgi:hypothetical protein
MLLSERRPQSSPVLPNYGAFEKARSLLLPVVLVEDVKNDH